MQSCPAEDTGVSIANGEGMGENMGERMEMKLPAEGDDTGSAKGN